MRERERERERESCILSAMRADIYIYKSNKSTFIFTFDLFVSFMKAPIFRVLAFNFFSIYASLSFFIKVFRILIGNATHLQDLLWYIN